MAMFFSAAERADDDAFVCTPVLWQTDDVEEPSAAPHGFSTNAGLLLCIAAYLGPLCILPYLLSDRSSHAYRHALRGMRLLVFACGYCFVTAVCELLLSRICWQLGWAASAVFFLLGLGFPLLAGLEICRIVSDQG